MRVDLKDYGNALTDFSTEICAHNFFTFSFHHPLPPRQHHPARHQVDSLADVSRYLLEQDDCKAAGVDLSPAGVLALAKCIVRISESLHAPKARCHFFSSYTWRSFEKIAYIYIQK